MNKVNKNDVAYFEAIATFVGTIIGAGVLGIPFAIQQAGFLTGLISLFGIAVAITLLNLLLGEIVLRTKMPQQLPGYAQKYLGKWAKYIMGIAMILGIYGALIAYIIGEGAAFSAIFGGSEFGWSIVFFILGAYLLHRGLAIIKKFELVMLIIIMVIILIIGFASTFHIKSENLFVFNIDKVFLPYGVVLFSFLGMSALQPVSEILKGQRKRLRRVIVISSFIPLFIYTLFTFIVIGVTGINTTQIATVGLGDVIGPSMIIFGNVFAIFAMGTSFLTLGVALKQTFNYDYKIKKNIAWLLTVSIPIIFYLLGVKDFIKTIAIVGGVLGGIQGVLVVLMYWRSEKLGDRKPEYDVPQHWFLGSILILMFFSGIFYTLFN